MPPEPQQGSKTLPSVGSRRHQGAHDGDRREVFTAALAFTIGEFADEVFVDAAEQVFAAVVFLEHVLGEQSDESAQVFGVHVGAGVDARQQAAQFFRVGLLDRFQHAVQAQLDVVRARHLDDAASARLPE